MSGDIFKHSTYLTDIFFKDYIECSCYKYVIKSQADSIVSFLASCLKILLNGGNNIILAPGSILAYECRFILVVVLIYHFPSIRYVNM